jgi:prolyl-tRNA synthetase
VCEFFVAAEHSGRRDLAKLLEKITPMDEDFGKWYTDIVKNAELIDYSGVRGCVFIRPYGCSIWENITLTLEKDFKRLGVENVLMPLLIPESLLEKEKNHVEGFAPEVAWVTVGGSEPLTERLCIRPTSEVLFCSHFSRIIQSWRDLPKIYNQWCSVVRWEKSSRPFLRSVEIHWQEGHTIHESPREAEEFTLKILNLYAVFFRDILCIPVILGKKTENEKFAGAEVTYTIECIMKDGKVLQSATSHYLGTNFARAFDIKFTNRKNETEPVYQTSWGLSTRVIAAFIMTHGDDCGLIVPPRIAPVQVIVIPISKGNIEITNVARKILLRLQEKFRVKIDESDQTPGWKFSQYEMKGVPIRLEIGPKDISNGTCVLSRRDTREKVRVEISKIENEIQNLLEKINENLYVSAKKRNKSKIFEALNKEDFYFLAQNKQGLIKTAWCGNSECEKIINEKTLLTSRCTPLEKEELLSACCPFCGCAAVENVFWGKAY